VKESRVLDVDGDRLIYFPTWGEHLRPPAHHCPLPNTIDRSDFDPIREQVGIQFVGFAEKKDIHFTLGTSHGTARKNHHSGQPR